MKLTAQEISVSFFALQCKNEKREPRVFGIGELKNASVVADKLQACTKVIKSSEDKDITVFTESDIELTTSEKALLLKCVEEIQWTAAEGGAVLSLKEKLE